MDVLDEELLRFWKELNENKVRYIMVRGLAIRDWKKYLLRNVLKWL